MSDITYTAFVGIPHANILTYWHSGTSFCILDSTIHPYAFHNDRIGCIYAPLSLLNRLYDHSVTKFFDPSRSLRNGHLSGHSRAGTDHPDRSARLCVPDLTVFLLTLPPYPLAPNRPTNPLPSRSHRLFFHALPFSLHPSFSPLGQCHAASCHIFCTSSFSLSFLLRVLLLSYSNIPTAAAVGTTRGYNSVAVPPSHSGYIVSWFSLLGRFLPRSINLSHTSNKSYVVTVVSSN